MPKDNWDHVLFNVDSAQLCLIQIQDTLQSCSLTHCSYNVVFLSFYLTLKRYHYKVTVAKNTKGLWSCIIIIKTFNMTTFPLKNNVKYKFQCNFTFKYGQGEPWYCKPFSILTIKITTGPFHACFYIQIMYQNLKKAFLCQQLIPYRILAVLPEVRENKSKLFKYIYGMYTHHCYNVVKERELLSSLWMQSVT